MGSQQATNGDEVGDHFPFYMSICVYVNRTIDDLHVVIDEQFLGALASPCILYCTHHSNLPEKEQN